jgi:hypothetical protein
VRRTSKLLALVLLAIGLASCGTSGAPPFVVTNAKTDVKITHCGATSNGYAVAAITVTNHASFDADYVTTITFSIDGMTAKSGPGFERGVAPGGTVADQVISPDTVSPGSKIICKVSTVSRTPSTVTTTNDGRSSSP